MDYRPIQTWIWIDCSSSLCAYCCCCDGQWPIFRHDEYTPYYNTMKERKEKKGQEDY